MGDMESIILKIVDRWKPLFEKMGIDYEMMRKILSIKLLLDGRRVPTIIGNNKKRNDADNKNMFFGSLWIYLLMGLILIPFIVMKYNYLYQMSFVFSIIMFMVMTSLISDFSCVILDIRDKNIIGTRPVNNKTLSMAKTVHIMIYMIFLTAALAGPAVVVSLFTQGPVFFLLFLLLLILIDLFCIILTTFVYFLILKFFDGEKLKDIINYVQILLSVVIMIGYQMFGRLFQFADLKIEFRPAWWQFLVTPVWFSAPFEMLKQHDFNSYLIIFTAMAVLIPILAFAIYVKLIPQFEQSLQKLGNNTVNRNAKGKSESRLVRLLCRNRVERVFYRFTADMMRNERSFKLKVYPTIGFSLVFPFIFMFQQFSDFKELTQGKSYFFIYFCGLMLPTVVMMLRYSESYKAAWIYKALPIGNMKPVFQGAIKAFMVRIFVPVYLIEAVIFGFIYGTRIIPDLMVVLLNMIILCILYFMLLDKVLPFSISFNTTQQSNAGIGIMLMLLMGVLAGLHFLFTLFAYGTIICLCILVIVVIILWKTVFNISMDKLGS